MRAWFDVTPHMRRGVSRNFDDPGLGTTLIVGNAKAPLEDLANPVGPDMMRSIQSYPLNLRRLEGLETRRRAPIANGYFTKYSGTVNCLAEKVTMDFSTVMIFGAAGISTIAAVVAVSSNRFSKRSAGIVSLAAGAVPWLFFAMWQNYIASSTWLSVVSIFGCAPLFLVSFFLYGTGDPTRMRGIAAGACIAGMFSGLGFSIVLANQLARME